MNEDQRMDLSALDPLDEPEGWRAFVEATMRRVDAVVGSRPKDPLTLIASWSRPLMLTGLVAIAVLVPVEIMLERRETETEPLQTLVRLSAESAMGASLPTGADLSRALKQDLP